MDDEGYYEDHGVEYDYDLGDENHGEDYLDDENHGEDHGLDGNHEVNDVLDGVDDDHCDEVLYDLGVDHDEDDVDHENHDLNVNHG